MSEQEHAGRPSPPTCLGCGLHIDDHFKHVDGRKYDDRACEEWRPSESWGSYEKRVAEWEAAEMLREAQAAVPLLITLEPAPRVVHFGVGIAAERSLDEPEVRGGCCGFFVRLAALAREDERLAALMGEYVIEVRHGKRVLWPMEAEG